MEKSFDYKRNERESWKKISEGTISSYFKEDYFNSEKFRTIMKNIRDEELKKIETKVRKRNENWYLILGDKYTKTEEEIRDEVMRTYETERKEERERINNEIFESEEHTGIIISTENLKSFELSNLVRLGLVKEMKSYNLINKPINKIEQSIYKKADIDLDVSSERILTELGELFIRACKEKNDIKHCL